MHRTKKSKAVARKVPVAGKAPHAGAGNAVEMSKCEVFQNTMEHDQASPLSPRCVGKNVRTNQAVVEGERKRKIAQEVRKGSGKGKGSKGRDHQQISMVMPDWMSFPPLSAFTAQET